ncbi:hypothetical protein [Photorhabdus sp. RM71S]|uniref:hypothetical protein n=1 Tax=Photorhabdus sp. RM71S TaxID=3342824 RepID=UPI0036DEA027
MKRFGYFSCIFSWLCIFLSFTANAKNVSCYDFYMRDGYTGFTFPAANFQESLDINGLVCYQGRDISSWVAGEGMIATTAIIPDSKRALAIVTVSEVNPESFESKSSIRVISIGDDGIPRKKDIIKQRYTEDPESSLYDMKITGYNYEKGIVYFEVPAWAVSHAIHAFTIPFDGLHQGIKEKYITPGDLTFVNMFNLSDKKENDDYIGYLVVNKGIIKEGEGRVYGEYLVTPEGETVCELDTNPKQGYWKSFLTCKK